MTTFEIIMTVAIIVIVVLLMRQIHRNTKVNEDNAEQISVMCEILSSIRGDTLDILQELNNIEDNNDQGFKKLTDIVDKMHRNLCVEIADKMVDRVCPPTYVTPCNPPDNISKWECVKCPKRSACGTLSTPTNTIKEE